jgi:hypothetical protein
MIKRIKCSETQMVRNTSCSKEFNVGDADEFLILAKNHYLKDEPHTKESAGNFFFTDKSQFDSDEGKNWAKQVFESNNIGEIIKRD